jgi:FkbM family methyltransferase
MAGLFNRSLGRVVNSLRRIPDLSVSCIRVLLRVRDPLQFLRCYIVRKPLPSGIVVFRDGTTIYVGHPDDLATINLIFFRAVYTGLARNDVVVDIGANIGIFSLYAALRTGAKKIYAFEPCRESFQLLQRNIDATGLTEVIVPFQIAVCHSRRGQYVDFPVSTSPSNSFHNYDGDKTVTVATTTLNETFDKNGLDRVNYLKVDCEGVEYEILEEMTSEGYGRIDNLTVEYHHGKEDELIRSIEAQGLRLASASKTFVHLGVLNFHRPESVQDIALARTANGAGAVR